MVELGGLMEVILYVQAMDSQVSFYRDVLGLRVTEPAGMRDLSQAYWVELETGACTLALHGGGQRRFGADAPKIVFRVRDVQAARAELLGQGVPMGEIRSPSPGVLVCDGLDPEGNRFSVESRSTESTRL
jgi:catechol 2,3-dioxygenase-like lactoylglutathione lyase family enzyme